MKLSVKLKASIDDDITRIRSLAETLSGALDVDSVMSGAAEILHEAMQVGGKVQVLAYLERHGD